MRPTLADSAEQATKVIESTFQLAGDSKRAPIPVLHLMNGVADSSITSIVIDQVKHFGDQKYDWHIGGLNGVAANEPFSRMNATVIDFSDMARGSIQLRKVVRGYVGDNRIELIHTHTPRTTMVAAFALAGSRRCRLVTTRHTHAAPQDRAAKGRLVTFVDRCAVYMPDQILAVSRDMQEKILKLPGIRPDRVSVIHNAVDSAAYYVPDQREICRAEFGVARGAPVLGYAGRLTKVKRIDLLLDAYVDVLKQYPTARLLIAGEGEEKQQQEVYAEKLGLSDRVIWAGQRRDVPRLLAAMDIYVQSSINEGLSLSLLQAMAARKPVVATDVGGTREVVSDRTGVLVSAGSSSRLAEAIIHVLDQPAETAKIVNAAKQLVEEQFSVRRQMEGYRKVYERLLPHDR